MDIKGRWGFSRNCCNRSVALMRSGHTPGKLLAKNSARLLPGSRERDSKQAEGANRVQVKDLSLDGMAMNMKELPGHICKWLGEMAKDESEVRGSMWNSHQRASMYSC